MSSTVRMRKPRTKPKNSVAMLLLLLGLSRDFYFFARRVDITAFHLAAASESAIQGAGKMAIWSLDSRPPISGAQSLPYLMISDFLISEAKST
ncbi:hypothetical protein O181_024290 [Austropuccinia psidii MF-1]|uniref:Uncharacterized protein n=1 Tax=Austropuccinia psidii MF-1 TaxID=1389203 RepID=A0A9Q3CKQ8_9BASI|nr:hypothetical protein [Austropuccinia psidii MF-1]